MALRGVNLPLAWVGQEKIIVEVFREIGLSNAEIATFLSGPAFQAWNRFGNIQGSWHGELPQTWIDEQFELQQKIIHRMIELGMTPVLPAFTGFVPANISRVLPNANVVRGSQWGGFPLEYTNDTFLEPFDENFAKLQASFIGKQQDAYGNVSHIYTLDQYNENDPYSGDIDYLRNVTRNTWHSLKQADPDAVWMMQGWLFYSKSEFWTNERVEAYLSGVESNDDMLILDLFSESIPEWRRTNSYFGKSWIWCQLHNFGGNMGLYGQIQNLTQNATEARLESPSMVGYGLSMEGQEGNEIVYDLLLDQAWSATPVDTRQYFHKWVTSRYAGQKEIPIELYAAWDLMRQTVYNNTNLTTLSVAKSIVDLEPRLWNLVDVVGTHGTNLNYEPSVLVHAWQLMYQATRAEPRLWSNPAYQHDMVDVTRQVMDNAFIPLYSDLVESYNNSRSKEDSFEEKGEHLLQLLTDLDSVLLTNRNFRLSTWIDSARAWAHDNKTELAFFEYNARNQLTLWGPNGEITDYASKQWSGLVSSYYIPRWRMFIEYLKLTPTESYNASELHLDIRAFELQWQDETWSTPEPTGDLVDLAKVLTRVVHHWPSVFGLK
jgi:alpha-N-acetylglucosaminidase